MSKGGNSSSGGPGCLMFVLTIIFFWFLFFGATIDGKHYGFMKCTAEKGVEFQH